MCNKMIDAGISVKHAATWTVSEAMREVVQNWLDVRHEFGCSGKLDYNQKLGYAYVSDRGPGLKIEHLAFGNNDKAASSIGQFGEGLKSAFVTLLREHRIVDIRSNGKIIKPIIQMSENFGVETLHYEISDAKTTGQGTNVRVYCTEEEFEAGKSYFSELDKRFNWVEKDRISLPGGFIYVNSSKVGNINDALFSYHLTRQEAGAILNRDRNAVDMNEANNLIADILNNTDSTKVAYKVLQALLDGVSCYEGTLHLYSHSDHVYRTAWSRLYNKKWLLPSGTENDANAIYRGYRILSCIGHDLRRFLESFGVQDSSNVFAAITAKKIAPKVVKVSEMTLEQRINLNWAKQMVRKYYAEPGKVVVSRELNTTIGCVDGVVAGCYNRAKNRICVLLDVLSDRGKTLETILHETVHKTSGANDVTAEFEQALLMVSVKIISEQEK